MIWLLSRFTFFFFSSRRRHTRLVSDWSSDVCSSDLNTDTERQEELRRQRAAALGRTVDELRAEALTKSNARRFGKPEDIAALALFLCSERARHVQGTAIAVDGGTTPGHY